ncbi:DesA family fatty acid desaturase [Thiofilum flexile]|uniref:DesA family fatty acid desaturase n=1 Tax=Thiofilum flexile TaxID=125627 RepID=UPI00037616D5|nr:fatty acid desaturase [Thiofilum flexile]
MGLLADLTGWQLVLITLVMTHITIVAVTVYLHRHQAHRAVELNAIPAHFFRFWLWLTTGMVTREWVAIHRKHHHKCETPDDPHSPQTRGLNKVLWGGALLYRQEAKNLQTIQQYSQGTPNDWLETHLYSRFPWLGITLMLLIDLALFGGAGLIIWGVQMIWIPFWAAGVINGLAHFWGYRNWNTADASSNISPIGIIIGGEELHNNHHAFAASARFSTQWYEFDIGWFYIRLLEVLKLAQVKRVAPRIKVDLKTKVVDLETLSAVIGNRLQVLSNFARQVVHPVIKQELGQSSGDYKEKSRLVRQLLGQPHLDESARERLQVLLSESQVLTTVYQFQQNLHHLWERTANNQEARLAALQEWIANAEQTGIQRLEEFAQRLKGYRVSVLANTQPA